MIRVQSGALTPEILWRHYAGNKVAPLCRQSTGSLMPETKWLHDAESSQQANLHTNISLLLMHRSSYPPMKMM